MLRTLRLARVARPQIAALGTTTTCKEKQLPWQLGQTRGVELLSWSFQNPRVPRTVLAFQQAESFSRARHPPRRPQSAGDADRASPRIPPRATACFETLTKAKLGPRRTLTDTPRTGAHPFSSFEKTLQGREAVEENLYIRDKEAAAKYKREAELQAERLADASKAFKKEFSQELATMLHQKHLAERQKALRK